MAKVVRDKYCIIMIQVDFCVPCLRVNLYGLYIAAKAINEEYIIVRI